MIGQANQGAITPLRTFDQKPIGNNNNKFQIPEYADNEGPGMIAQQYNPEPKPLGERLKKNILKIKKEALQELLGLMRADPKQFEPYTSLTIDFLSFKDMVIQERGLKAAVMYLQAGYDLGLDPKALIKVLIEKCLCLQKEDIKHNSETILFWFMDNKFEEVLLSELNDYLLSKNRKVVATSILFIANLLHNYGIKRMKSLERFAKNLELFSVHAKPIAKAQTIILFKELYRWIGESALKDFKIHPQVKDEVAKFGKQYVKVPLEIKRGVAKVNGNQGQKGKAVFYMEQEQNQNCEPVDVLSSYTSQWVDSLLKMEKWKEKKSALQEFIKKIKVPAILAPRETGHFIFLIKKLLADNNINICYCGFYITQNLSKGLKKDFSHIAKNILNDVYAKIKDLKAMTVDLAQNTLKSLLHSLSCEDFMENIKEGLNDKSPLMKEETLKFMLNFLQKKDNKSTNVLRTLVDRIINLTEDGAAKVRTQALQTLCALKIAHGMKFFGEKTKHLDPKKLQTLELAKAPAKQEEERMEVQEATVNTAESYQPKPQIIEALNKESNTLKAKQSKQMQVQPQTKLPPPPKNMAKNDDSSSINSMGESKVARTLSLSCLDDIASPSEAVRTAAYQQISTKFLSKDVRQFIKQMRNNSVKQSSPVILKLIIQIAKKYVNNGITELELVQFLIKHDWKKSKQLLQEFIQSNRFSVDAQELMKSLNLMAAVPKPYGSNPVPASVHPLKTFCLELQNNLISKMSSPIDSVKKEAAEYAISLWESMPKIASEAELTPSNGWHEQHITKFFNIVKCRLSDPSQDIAGLYCRLLGEMINKGITVKQKAMKTMVQIVYSNLSKGFCQLRTLFKEMVVNAPAHMFSTMQSELFMEGNREAIVQFIVENSQLFIKYADLKSFMSPLLHILCTNSLQPKLRQTLDSVFTQMIEISGVAALEKEVSKLKVSNMDAYNKYLGKFNLCLNKNNYANTGRNFRLKEDRLKYWQEQQWTLEITSNQILKLVNMMSSIEPLNSFCTLLYLNEKQLNQLHALEFNTLAEYSDIFFKFIYWRTQIDPLNIVEDLLKLTSRLILATNYLITEIDIIVVMRTFINLIQRFKDKFRNEIVQILKRLFNINVEIQQDTLLFWLNFLTTASQTTANEILTIFMSAYENSLAQSLVQLARISTVHKHEPFIKFLQHKFQIQHLTASGFRLATSEGSKGEAKALLSQLGGPQNVIQIDASEKCQIWQMFLQSSDNLGLSFRQMEKLEAQNKVGRYVKILYTVIPSFYRGEIQFINIFSFLKELQRVLSEPYHTKKAYLRELTRMLIYFLVDLDEHPPNGIKCEQIIKMVNKCILTLIETSQVRHMLQVLFLLAKRHLQLNISSKLVHLIIKCVIRTAKGNEFKVHMAENIRYIFEEVNNIFIAFDIQPDSGFIKSFKNLYVQVFKHYPISIQLIYDQIKNQNVHISIQMLYEEFAAAANQAVTQPEAQPLADHNANAVRNISSAVIGKICSLRKPEQA